MEVLHGEEDRQLPLSILFFKNSIRLPLSLVLVVQFFLFLFRHLPPTLIFQEINPV
jgi:hypothetical protein